MSGIEETLQQVLSPDNNTRKQAEQALESYKDQDASKLMQDLYNAMGHQQDTVCNLACVLFKKYFLDAQTVSNETLQMLEQNIFNLLDFDRSRIVLHAQGSVVVRIYAKLNDIKTLLGKIIELNKHDNPSVRELSMYMLEILVDVHIPQELASESIGDFKSLFKQGLEDSELRVKVASLKATSSFITSLGDFEIAIQLADLMSIILNIMIEALKSDEDAGKSTLESLIDIADFHPDIFKDYGSTLVEVISQIMLNKDFEDGTRSSAKEVLLSLLQKAPGMVRKIENIKTHFYPALFEMMTEVPHEDDLETWNQEDEEEDVTRTDPHGVAREALIRFARIIGEQTTIDASLQLIKDNIVSEDWKRRQAGYFFLGYIAEACKEIFKKNLDETMKMSAAGVVDPHPRVQYAGLTCLGLMLTEQSPNAQKKFHAEIVPQLLEIMNSDSLIKVKTQAASATVNFVRELIHVDENEIEDTQKEVTAIENYTDDILETCAKLFSQAMTEENPALQEEVLALISCVATLIDTKFVKYYPQFMPGLQTIIKDTPCETQQQKDLRSNTIQTIGFLLDAVKESEENVEGFKNDAKDVIQIFNNVLNSEKIDEQEITAITNALTQVAAVLKEDFAPFMPDIMTRLLNDTQVNVDFKLEDAEIPNLGADENLTSVTFKMKGFDGQKKLSLNTTALETKINSVVVIKTLAQNLKTTFYPYVNETLEKLSPLFDYKYSRAVRGCSIEACQYLILACEDVNDRVQLMQKLAPIFKESITNLLTKKDTTEIVVFLKEYYHCIKIFSKGQTPLGPSQIESIIKQCAQSCELSAEDKKLTIEEIEKQRHNIDEEDLDVFREQLDEIEKIFMYTMEISGQLMRIYREDVTDPVKDNLLKLFAENINKSENTEHETIDSLCFFIDCCEFLSLQFFSEIYEDCLNTFFTIYDKYQNHDDRDLVQSVAFGLGVIAQRLPSDKFQQYAQKIFGILETLINVEDPLNDDNGYATDNSLSSLLKLVYYQKSASGLDDAKVQHYLSFVPLEQDLDESLAVNKLLIEQVEAQNPNLLGDNNANLAAVKDALTRMKDLHDQDPELKTLDEEYYTRLVALMS